MQTIRPNLWVITCGLNREVLQRVSDLRSERTTHVRVVIACREHEFTFIDRFARGQRNVSLRVA